VKYVNGRVEGLRLAYIGGGSRGWAWGLMSDLAVEPDLSGTVSLYDIDKEAAEKNAVIGNKMNTLEGCKSEWKYEVSNSLQEALTGADFVIISILPGTFEEMRSDVHTPEKYGIYQSVGDTVGPGGYIRALRTIPMYVEIAQAIKKYSPKAWVINYTNPMSVCTGVLYRVFPQIKAFGCCHEVFGTQKVLAAMVKHVKGIEEVKRQDIKVNVVGINHFTWFTKASYLGEDLFPMYDEFTKKYSDGFSENEDKDHWMNNSFTCVQKVKFDLFQRYGYIAAAGDRHLAEFIDGSKYLKNPDVVKSWKFGLTTVDWRINDLKKRLERRERLVSGEETYTFKETGEDGVRQIKALLGLSDLVTNVNIPNAGQIPNLPLGTIVETNALFRQDRVEPIMAGDIPYPIYGLITPHVNNQEAITTAALTEDKKLAFAAFANDPLVRCLSYTDTKALFDEMLANTSKYLPDYLTK